MCRAVLFAGTCTTCGNSQVWEELAQELSCLDAKNAGYFGECLRGVAVEHHRFDQECDACSAAAEAGGMAAVPYVVGEMGELVADEGVGDLDYDEDDVVGAAAAKGPGGEAAWAGSGDSLKVDGGMGGGGSAAAAAAGGGSSGAGHRRSASGFASGSGSGSGSGGGTSGGREREKDILAGPSTNRSARQVRERDRERDKEQHKSKRQKR